MNNPFRNRFSLPRLTRDEAGRQGRITQFALLSLGQAKAITFLNGHDDELAGRPLTVATQSPEGFAAVEKIIMARAATA